MNNFYHINNLKFKYKKYNFRLNVDELKLYKSGLTCIIGPNGSGKSTFLKLCSGRIKGYSGSVNICGKNISDYSLTELAKKVAYLPQDTEKGSNYKVEDIVMMGRYPHQGRAVFPDKNDMKIVYDSLEKAGAEAFLKRDYSLLSGGEKKRILIASVIAQESEFLLLDEPTSSLDIANQSRVFELLKNLKKNDKGVVVATHNINLASIFADNIILFQNGKIIESGSSEKVITKKLLEPVYGNYIEIFDHPVFKKRKIILPGTKGCDNA